MALEISYPGNKITNLVKEKDIVNVTIKFNDEEQTLLFTTINSNGYIEFTEFTVDENNGGFKSLTGVVYF